MDDTDRPRQKLRGVAMDRPAIDEFLRERGTGTLSLADGDEAYGVPISFGYDGDSLYFFLIRFGDESTKLDFAETTARACFSTYEFADEHHWRSVLARGPIERVTDADAAERALSDNAEFASLFPYGEPMTEWPRYRLAIETVTGQQSQGYDD